MSFYFLIGSPCACLCTKSAGGESSKMNSIMAFVYLSFLLVLGKWPVLLTGPLYLRLPPFFLSGKCSSRMKGRGSVILRASRTASVHTVMSGMLHLSMLSLNYWNGKGVR